MRITLDTNVLVSATFWNGDSSRIIDRIERKEIELVLSQDIIDEFAAVLCYDEIQKKIKHKNLEMKLTVEKVRSLAKIVMPTQLVNIIKEDPDDNKVLACAKEGKVDFVVTSDHHLLKLSSFEEIKIINPKELLKKLNNLSA